MRIAPTAPPAPPVRLLPELADFAAREHGDAAFSLRWTGTDWRGLSFAEFAAGVRGFATLLRERGLEPGGRVVLHSENRPEWGLAYLGVLAAGGIVVPLDAQHKAQEVGEVLAACAPSHGIAGARTLEALATARAERPFDLIALDPAPGLPSWPEWSGRHPQASPIALSAAPDDPAVILFTSGTFGRPKGVLLSHANLLHNVEAVVACLEFGPRDRFLSVLPLHHTFEATGGFLCPLRAGASIAYARGLQSGELREDLRTSRATILLGVPLLYEKLLAAVRRGIADAPPARRMTASALLGVTSAVRVMFGARIGRTLLRPLRERAGLGTLRAMVSGAAPLAPEVFHGLVDLGIPVLEGYGLTECSPVVAANRVDHSFAGAVGWPVPGVEVRIERPDAEGNGEILVRGPNVMLGYFGDPESTAEVLRDGWFRTGDLGQLVSDGHLRITGRLKNMIATAAGKKIYPEEIETLLAGSPYVLEVVVAGGRDARGDREEVHAHVVPNRAALEVLARERGETMDAAFIARVVKHEVESRCEHLAPYKRVKRVIVHEREFAKTTTGKIRRQSLSDEGSTAAVDRVA